MQVPVAEDELIDVKSILDGEQVLTSCNGEMRLIGTAVIPDDFERSMTMIVGSSGNNVLHQGSAELDESRIRGIYSDSVVLQTASGGLCELAMFDAGTAEKPPAPAKPKQKKKKPARPSANRNAGLTPEELEAGITMRSPTLVHIGRELFSKVLDNPENLTGSATVTPKIERGRFMGLRIGVMRPHGAVHELGMLAGDIIENIDGKQLPSTDAVLKALTSLRTADGFTVAVQRYGQTLNIRYNIDKPKDP
jgi:type II secretory pathway component PulC